MAAKWAERLWVQDANALQKPGMALNLAMMGTCLAGIAYPLIPNTYTAHFSCLSHTLLGIPCPACGYVRASHALMQGDLFLSLQYNPAWLFFVVLQACLIFMAIGSMRSGHQWRFSKRASMAIGGGIGAAWLFQLGSALLP